MRHLFVLPLLLLPLFLAGCGDFEPVETGSPDEAVLCAADVMVCPDGSYARRNPDDNCDFFPCPSEGYGDPAKEWGNGSLE